MLALWCCEHLSSTYSIAQFKLVAYVDLLACVNTFHQALNGSLYTRLGTAQKAMKDEKIESRLANDTRNTRYVFHCSPVVKHRRCRLLLINRNGNRSP